MDKSCVISPSCYDNHHLCFAFLFSFLFCSLLLSFHAPNLLRLTSKTKNVTDSCTGRYVYIHQLPSRFNDYLLQNCQSLTRGTDKPNMCPYMQNNGLGPHITNSQGLFSNNISYATNQLLLEA